MNLKPVAHRQSTATGMYSRSRDTTLIPSDSEKGLTVLDDDLKFKEEVLSCTFIQ